MAAFAATLAGASKFASSEMSEVQRRLAVRTRGFDPKVECAPQSSETKGLALDFWGGPLRHQMMAGCDLLLMPCRYEPCGLPQMYSQMPLGILDSPRESQESTHMLCSGTGRCPLYMPPEASSTL